MDPQYHVFISYNSTDADIVHRLAERLRRERIELWLDKWALTAGGSWQVEIAQGLAASAACAVMVGPGGLGDWAREELAVAQDRAAKDRTFRIFMVLLRGAPEVSDPSLAFLRTRTWVDMRDGITDDNRIQDLVAAITGVARTAPEPLDGDPEVSPYRGLASFEEDHADYFFGREDDTARVLEFLKTGRFVAILGPSGSGKSSLARAGVLPAVRAGRLPGSEAWTTRVLTPGPRPLVALAGHLAQLFPHDSMQQTLEQLQKDPRSLDLAVSLAMADRPRQEQLVLVVDQFEELFTMGADDAERASFVANLCYAATIPGGRVVLVVAMRADFYQHCAAFTELRTLVSSRQFLVGPLTEDGLRRAIEEPARRAGVDLESGVLETIIADVGNQAGALPLLQHVLLELWQRRIGRMLTLDAYVAAGRLEGALAKRANIVYQALTPAQQQTARRVLLRLVRPGEGAEDTRRRAEMGELMTPDDDPADVERVIEALADERLLTSGSDEASGARVVDITHEALIRGWPELRGWIAQHRDELVAERRLTDAALDWDQCGHDDSLLYRGARLAEWEERDPGGLNQREREFLAASLKRQTRERSAGRRRVRVAVSAALVGLTAIAVVAIVGLNQVAHQRDLASAGLAVANANSQLPVDPQRSLLIARTAYKMAPTPQAEQALRQATLESTLRRQTSLPAPSGATFSPDGRLVVTASSDGQVRIWDWAAGTTRTFSGHKGAVSAVAFSPSGQFVLSGGTDDGTMRIWDLASGQAVKVLKGQQGAVNSVAFSPDGKTVASGGLDGTVAVWDVATGTETKLLRDDPQVVRSVQFSPDGRYIVSGGGVAIVWDWRASSQVKKLRSPGLITVAGFSPDGALVASGASDGTVRMWDWANGVEVKQVRPRVGPNFSVAFSPDGKKVLVGVGDGSIAVTDWAVGGAESQVLLAHQAAATATFSPDGSAVVSSGLDGTVRIWDWSGGAQISVASRHQGQSLGAAFNPDNTLVASGGVDGTIQVADRTKGTVLAVEAKSESPVLNPVFSPDGKLIASAGGNDGTVRVWDWASGQVTVYRGNQNWVNTARFSPDGQLLVSAGWDGTVRIWERATNTEVAVLHGHLGHVNDARFSPDGRLVVSTGQDGTIRVWDWRLNGASPTILRGHQGPVNTVAFSLDGRNIVSAGTDGTVRVWSWPGGAQTILRGHQAAVTSASFSPDGTQVVSTGFGGGLRVWDWRQSRTLLVLTEIVQYNASFGRSGGDIVSSGVDGAVRIWRCETCGPISEVLALAQQRTIRQLTVEERQTFLPKTPRPIVSVASVVVALILLTGSLVVALLLTRMVRRRPDRPPAPPGPPRFTGRPGFDELGENPRRARPQRGLGGHPADRLGGAGLRTSRTATVTV